MTTQDIAVNAVKQTIDELIQAGTSFDINALERLYHHKLLVITIDQSGTVSTADKSAFKGLFETKLAAGAAPLNTWAQYNHIHVNESAAHVLITRKVNLADQNQLLTLSIDLVFEDGRWQITREVIFARPDS